MITWMNLSLIQTLKPDLDWAQPLRPTQRQTRQPGLQQNLLYFSNMLPFIDSLKEMLWSLVVHNVRLTICHCPLPCLLHHFDYHPSSIMIDFIWYNTGLGGRSFLHSHGQLKQTKHQQARSQGIRSPTLLAWMPKLKPSMHSALSPQCSRSSLYCKKGDD